MRNQVILGLWALRANKPNGEVAEPGGNMKVPSSRKMRPRGQKGAWNMAVREPKTNKFFQDLA